MQIEVITDREAAGALRSEWDVLLGECVDPSVFLTPEWLLSWWDAFAGDRRMCLLAIRDRGRLAGVAPFASDGRVLAGWSNQASDRFGLIVSGQEVVEAVARHLVDEAPAWSRLDLVPLSTASPATAWLGDALSAVGAGNRVQSWFRSPIVDLPDDPDVLFDSLSGSFRSTVRRKRRAAERNGWTTEIRTDAAAVDVAIEVAADSWAHREGTGIGSTPENHRFYTSVAREAAERGWLRLGLLRDGDGEALAFELNLVRRGDAVNLKLGYREAVSAGSPGLVLRAAVVEGLVGEGARTFDLLGQDESYKLHWTDRTVEHVRLRAYPATMRGRIRHAYRHSVRPLVGRVLAPLRTLGRDRG